MCLLDKAGNANFRYKQFMQEMVLVVGSVLEKGLLQKVKE